MNSPKLQDVSLFISKGTTPTTIGGKFVSEGINFVKSESIGRSKFLDSSVFEHIDGETDEKLKRSRLQEGDLLFSIAGAYLGKLALVTKGDAPANTNQAVGIVRLDRTLADENYAYYFYSQPSINAYINKLSAQSSQPNLNLTLLGDLPFSDNPLSQQTRIAAVLSALDAKIELNNRINVELEAMAKTLYNYWFVQFDFPDANGQPYKTSGGKMVFNEKLKREVPEGWEARPLSKITGVSNESISPELTPSVEFRHYSIPVFDAKKTYGLECGSEIHSNKFLVAGNDVLVSKLNPQFSRIVYPIAEDHLICSTEFVIWRAEDKTVKSYLYQVAKSEHFQVFCIQSATGTSHSHKRVNPDLMLRYQVPFDDVICRKFGETVKPLIMKSVRNQIESTQLAALRDWLLPMLMNGQVQVG